nr:hypothetical protein [Pseudenhygromyxa sp. WMMC2535]
MSNAEAARTRGRVASRPSFSGYHLYDPSRRQPSAAFELLVEALRYRGFADAAAGE